MNDKLRFRVWDKVFNQYWTKEVIKENASWLLFPNNSNINDIEIERYTGFKDKNGKLIYEGDRVTYSNNLTGEVVFTNGCFYIKRVINTRACGYTKLYSQTSVEIIENT